MRPLSALLTLALCATAQAEGWDLRRRAFDPRIAARAVAAAMRNPTRDAAFNKLVRLYEKHRSIAALIQVVARRKESQRHILLFRLYWHQGDKEEAGRFLEQARPWPKKLLPLAARFQLVHADTQEALATYEDAIGKARGKEKQALLREAGEAALKAGKEEVARRWLLEIADAGGRPSHKSLELARLLSEAGATVEAARLLQTAIDSRPQLTLAGEMLRELANLHDKLGDQEAATKALEDLVRRLPGDHWMRREALQRLVSLARKRGELSGLRGRVETLLKRRGFPELEMLARLDDELGQTEQAERYYRRALRLKPYALELRLRLIALLERAGRDVEALREHARLVSTAPGEPRYVVDYAERLWRAGRSKEALAKLSALERRYPRDAPLHELLANLYLRWGLTERVKRITERLARIAPDDESNVIALGQQHFQEGRKQKALKTWQRILQIVPQRKRALATFAGVLADHDMLEASVAHYRKALRLDPHDPSLHRALALVLERSKHYEEAVPSWEKVLAHSHGDKGLSLRRQARSRMIQLWQKSRTLYSRITDLRARFSRQPPDIQAGYLLAEAEARLRRLDRASSIYEQIAKLEPQSPEALLSLEALYRQRGELDGALRALERLASMLPKRATEFYSRMSTLALRHYRDDDALTFAKKALEAGSSDAAGWQRLAEIHERKEDTVNAIEAYHKALEINPRRFEIHFTLARLHLRRGEPEKASNMYRQIVREATDDQMVGRAGLLAIDLDEYLGRLVDLERELQPLATQALGRKVFRMLLVEIYARRSAAADEIDDDELKPLLETLATEDDPERRGRALAVLVHSQNGAAAEPLLSFAERARPSSTSEIAALIVGERVSALAAAAQVATPQHRRRFEALLEDREGAVREAATYALARLASPRSEDALRRMLGDPKAGVQVFACLGLARIGTGRSRQLVVAALDDSRRVAPVRGACALGATLFDPRPSDLGPALIRLLAHGWDVSGQAAAVALGLLRDRSGIEPLVMAHLTGRRRLRDAALQGLSAHAGEAELAWPSRIDVRDGQLDWTTFLQEMLDVTAPGNPATLIATYPAEIAAAVSAALGRPRDVLIRVLYTLEGDGGVELGELTARSGELPPAQQAEIRPALAKIEREVTPVLALLAGHRDPQVRAAALRVVGSSESSDALETIVAALSDPAPNVRATAALAAGRVARARAPLRSHLAQQLGKLLDDEDWQARRAAARALSSTGRAAVKLLTRAALSDSNPFVRQSAIESLGTLDALSVRRVLTSATRDTVVEVAQTARQTLATLQQRGAASRNTMDPVP